MFDRLAQTFVPFPESEGPRADDTNYCQAKYMLLTNVARKYGLTSIFFKIFMIKTFQLTTIIFSTVLFE